jgi:hypothetical protein
MPNKIPRESEAQHRSALDILFLEIDVVGPTQGAVMVVQTDDPPQRLA